MTFCYWCNCANGADGFTKKVKQEADDHTFLHLVVSFLLVVSFHLLSVRLPATDSKTLGK